MNSSLVEEPAWLGLALILQENSPMSTLLPFSWSKMFRTHPVDVGLDGFGRLFVAHAQPQAPSAPEQYIMDWSEEAVYQMAVHGISPALHWPKVS